MPKRRRTSRRAASSCRATHRRIPLAILASSGSRQDWRDPDDARIATGLRRCVARHEDAARRDVRRLFGIPAAEQVDLSGTGLPEGGTHLTGERGDGGFAHGAKDQLARDTLAY